MSLILKNVKNRATITKNFKRASYWDINTIIKILEDSKNRKKYFKIGHIKVKTATQKNNLFVLNYKKNKGICKCEICGIEAKYFALEKSNTVNSINEPYNIYHFNMYTIDKVSLMEIYFNIDHIKPRSKGGRNDISNMQLTCEECNKLKSDKYTPPNNNRKTRQNKNDIKPIIKTETGLNIFITKIKNIWIKFMKK